MWPWEHLAFGYVAYSVGTRVRHRSPPEDAGTITLAVATQLPDLIDKPLAWGLQILPGGRTLAHSLLVAVPLIAIVAAITHRRGNPEVGVAFAIGYLSHLLGDVLSPLLIGQARDVGFLLWPVVAVESEVTAPKAHFWSLVVNYLEYATSSAGIVLVLFEGLLLATALWLWLTDGTPGIDQRWTGRSE